MGQKRLELLMLVVLALWLRKSMVKGCLGPLHFQEEFCSADIVIRARVIEMKTTSVRIAENYSTDRTQYKIRLIKMFKGFDKVNNIQHIYTLSPKSSCFGNLDAKNKVQYLLLGHITHEGKVEIPPCGSAEPWHNLSLAKKENLNEHYQKGCECKISHCFTLPCHAPSENECIWTDETGQNVCMKKANGSCNWF